MNTEPVAKPTDIHTIGAALYFLPVQTRVPLKFGAETLTTVTCARAKVQVRDAAGRTADGWGETPLSVQWVWPSSIPYETRLVALQSLCIRLTDAWADFEVWGDPIEVGHEFVEHELPRLRDAQTPWLAALVCS